MANDYFRFKQFLVRQDKAAFKVGTDGVLLGAWTDVSGVDRVLDIGSGTGLLALMAAQRCDARITAVEIEPASFTQAKENIAASPWKERIEIIHTSFQEYYVKTAKQFGLILTNPPWFRDSVKPEDAGKSIARHNLKLPFRELVGGVKKLLTEDGRFCLVLPSDESLYFRKICLDRGLYLNRVLMVRPRTSMPPKRYLMEFRHTSPTAMEKTDICVEMDARHEYSKEYKDLTGEFYLAF